MAFDRIRMPDIRKYFKRNKSGRPKFKQNFQFEISAYIGDNCCDNDSAVHRRNNYC